jgi:phosphomevalonate kinase
MLLSYAFAGESASTESMIKQVEARLDEAARAEFVRRSDELSAQLEDALIHGELAALQSAAQGLHALLCSLGPLETEAMRRLLSLAKSQGAAGKMSGAGGGDGCILFSRDEDERTRLLEALAARGFLSFPLTVEPGLRGETSPDPRLSQWLAVR